MKKILLVIGCGFVLVISIILISTFLFTSKNTYVQPADVNIPIDDELIPQRLAESLKFQTISHQDPVNSKLGETRSFHFHSFHTYLERKFPNVHTSLRKEIVNDLSLLYTWEGSDAELKPILLMAHQDVVPINPGTEKDWVFPPFNGKISDGYIWGRGALDIKSSLMGIMEAIELLLRDGFKPRRTVYIAFGHDEEIGGKQGAAKIAELLHGRDIKLEYVLDEGGAIIQGIVPGVSSPIALVGIAEKGYVSLELTVEGQGGHSSMPPKHTAVGILSSAITKLENHPFPANMTHIRQLFEYISPKLRFTQKTIFANLWLFKPLVEKKLSNVPAMNAGIRTTTAATMFSGSTKENVLPEKATAVVNFRIMPGESITSVVDYVKKIIDDLHIQVSSRGFSSEPSPVSDANSRSYEILRDTIHQIVTDKELIVAPYLVLGGTDSRYFTGLSDNVYRFSFYNMDTDDLKRIHGTNERISVKDYFQVVKFYYQLIRNSNKI